MRRQIRLANLVGVVPLSLLFLCFLRARPPASSSVVSIAASGSPPRLSPSVKARREGRGNCLDMRWRAVNGDREVVKARDPGAVDDINRAI